MASKIKRVEPEAVLKVVASLRSDSLPGTFCFDTAKSPLSGKQCCVFVLSFSDGDTWAVRIPIHAQHLPPSSITYFVSEEVEILQTLQEKGFNWSPRLIAFDAGFDNLISFPYIVFSWIPGKPLQWSDSIPPERKDRDKIIQQLMDIILELARCTVYGKATPLM